MTPFHLFNCRTQTCLSPCCHPHIPGVEQDIHRSAYPSPEHACDNDLHILYLDTLVTGRQFAIGSIFHVFQMSFLPVSGPPPSALIPSKCSEGRADIAPQELIKHLARRFNVSTVQNIVLQLRPTPCYGPCYDVHKGFVPWLARHHEPAAMILALQAGKLVSFLLPRHEDDREVLTMV